MRTIIVAIALCTLAWAGAAQEPTDGRLEIRHMDDPALLRIGIEIDTTGLPADPYVRDAMIRIRTYKAQRDYADTRQVAMQRRIDAGENAHVQVVRVEQWDRLTVQIMRLADAIEAWSQSYDTGSEARIKALERKVARLERSLQQRKDR